MAVYTIVSMMHGHTNIKLSNVIWLSIGKKVRLNEHAVLMGEKRHSHRVGRPRHRLDNIKMDFN